MELFYREYGEQGDRPLVVLHGLFGMSDNWAAIGKRIAGEGFHVVIPDQRNHGRSGHSDVHNYPAMVDDLLEFMDARGLDRVSLLGHSMGGKTAMQFAFDEGERVDRLIVADISPDKSDQGRFHTALLDALLEVDLSGFDSRSDAGDALAGVVSNARLRQFLMKNIYWKDRSQLGWRMNLRVLRDNLEEVFRPVGSDAPFDKPVLFLRGGASDYVKDSDSPLIESLFPQVKIKSLDGASHWLHAEKPDAFVREVLFFLQ